MTCEKTIWTINSYDITNIVENLLNVVDDVLIFIAGLIVGTIVLWFIMRKK